MNNEKIFLNKIKEVNSLLLSSELSKACLGLDDALKFYVENHLENEIPNVFDHVTNVLNGFNDKVLVLSLLMRIIEISKEKKLTRTFGIYSRYLALAQAFYSSPSRGLEIIKGASEVIKENTPIYIELINAKAVILYMKKSYNEALDLLKKNYVNSKKINYIDGYRFASNIGTLYREISDYDNAIKFLSEGIDFADQYNLTQTRINAVIELSCVYNEINEFDISLKYLNSITWSKVIKINNQMRKKYLTYKSIAYKGLGDFKNALECHENLLEVVSTINEKQSKMTVENLNLQNELKEKENENLLIKNENTELEIVSRKLNDVNEFLNVTLNHSTQMQERLEEKNTKLEKLMKDLKHTQERLTSIEKHSVLNETIINIAENMSTPIGVLNTATSHVKRSNKKILSKYNGDLLKRKDLERYFEDIEKSINLYEVSTSKLVSFIDSMKHYNFVKEKEIIQEIDLKERLLEYRAVWYKTKKIDEIKIECNDKLKINIQSSLLDKFMNLIIDKFLLDSNRKLIELTVSTESENISIGIGNFTGVESCSKMEFKEKIEDEYLDFIITTIVEELLGGRIIKFENHNTECYQIVLPKNI